MASRSRRGMKDFRYQYIEGTGMFEEVPTARRRVTTILRTLCWPFRAGWSIISCPFKFVWRLVKTPFSAVEAVLSFPRKAWEYLSDVDFEDLFDSLLSKIGSPLRWFFSPFIKVWYKIRNAYRKEDWVTAGLWLIPAYLLFVVYRYVILLVFGVGWSFISGIVIWLWNVIAALAVWLWQIVSAAAVWLWH